MATSGTLPTPQRSPLKRPGCILGLILWFVVLLTPCFLIMLAVRGEISVTTGPVPEQRLRVWLIQEPDQSGIGISNVSVQGKDESLCVQTNVNFVLWRGEAQPTQYCECYALAGDSYEITEITQEACSHP
jgi:hypothetical protein